MITLRVVEISIASKRCDELSHLTAVPVKWDNMISFPRISNSLEHTCWDQHSLLIWRHNWMCFSKGGCIKLLHVDRSPWRAIVLSNHHHPVLPNCRFISWYPFKNPQLYIHLQLVFDLLLPMDWDSCRCKHCNLVGIKLQ